MDQYLSFISPSPSLFSLLPPPPPSVPPTSPAGQSSSLASTSTYSILNSPSSTEQQIEDEIERVANGLFSAVATVGPPLLFPFFSCIHIIYIGHVPFIRAPRGNAAEMIAKKVETKIRDALLSASRAGHSSTSLFTNDATGLSTLQRPRMFSLITCFKLILFRMI